MITTNQSLAVIHSGPGAQVAEFEIKMIQALNEIQKQNYQIQKETADLQQTSTECLAKSIVEQAEASQQEMLKQANATIGGACAGAAAMVGGPAVGWGWGSRLAEQNKQALENIQTTRDSLGKLPNAGHQIEMRPLNEAAPASERPAAVRDVLNWPQNKEAALAHFQGKSEQFQIDHAQSLDEIRGDTVHRDNKAEVSAKLDQIEDHLKDEKAKNEKYASDKNAQAQTFGQLAASAAQGAGLLQASPYKTEAAEKEKMKEFMNLIMSLIKTSQDIAQQGVNQAQQSRSSVLQMESSIYQANSRA